MRFLIAALALILPACGGDREREAERALRAAAPAEYGVWKAAADAREAALEPISEGLLGIMEMQESASERRLSELASELEAKVATALETRNENLRIAQEAEERAVEVWNERRGDLRFARPGFGIGVGNAAVAAVQRAQREAARAVREFEAADAEAERVTAEAQAEYGARVEEEHTNLLASFTPEGRALYVAVGAENLAQQRLVEAVPEAWAAFEADQAQFGERERQQEGLLTAVTYLLAVMGLALIPARIAQKKGRSFLLWWLYGLPVFLIALIHSLIMSADDSALTPDRVSE